MAVQLKTYKRKPSPSLQSSQLKDQSMVITNYLANELQELENVLVIQEQADGEKTQTLIDLNTAVNTNTASITSEATTRSTADTALATLVTDLTATVTSGDNTNSAAISSEATARANADSALSSTVSSLTSTVNGVSASVTAEASARVAADNTLLAKYGVTLNSNGYVTGFSQNNDGTTGTFKILADKFTIVDPSDSAGEAGTQVFDITGGVVTINGSLVVNGSLNVAGKASSGSVGAISGTAGNDVTMTSYSEISQTNFVNAAPQHIAAANHSDGSVSAGDVMGGTPLYSFNFTTYAFSGTKDFIVSTLLDPIGYYNSASSTGFAFAMKATTSATDYASTSASAYVSTKGTSKGGTLSSQNYMLSDVVSLSGNTQYYIWVFGVMDDVGTSGGKRGIRDGQITVAGLNI